MRPKVVLTTGAGVAVPFAWVARLRGAKVVYVESLARIEGPSLTCRLIAPIATRRYVQWPELAGDAARRALRRQRLLGGRMIFVTVGTNEAPLRPAPACGRRAASSSEELVVQHGTRPAIEQPDAELVDFLSFEEMVETIRRARVVVTHAGVGSVMVALANGKCPIVVPAPEGVRRGRRRSPAPARPTLRSRGPRDARRGARRAGRRSLGEQQPARDRPDARARSRPISRLPRATRSRVRWRRHRMTPAEQRASDGDRLPHPERNRLEGGLAGRRSRSRAWSSRSSSRGC